jgi:hypothetical protein
MTVDIYVHLMPDRDKSAINILDKSGTPMAPSKKESLVTNEDYEASSVLVVMQGIDDLVLFLSNYLKSLQLKIPSWL